MDEVHKLRIKANLSQLIAKTKFEALVHSFERMDKLNATNYKIIPDHMMSKWKQRAKQGQDLPSLNSSLYKDIQHRGPDAFPFLIECLRQSGNEAMACLLDPTLKEPEASQFEPNCNELEYYNEDGYHAVFIDKSWEGKECIQDRSALREFFSRHGYEEIETTLKEDVGSIIIINFSSLNNGGTVREKAWIHDDFNLPQFDGKPKILISFRYMDEKGQQLVHQDAGQLRKPYRDVMKVKIYLREARKEAKVSPEIENFIQVFSRNDTVNNIHEKLMRLQHEFNKNNWIPVTVEDSGFKSFRFKKCTCEVNSNFSECP